MQTSSLTHFNKTVFLGFLLAAGVMALIGLVSAVSNRDGEDPAPEPVSCDQTESIDFLVDYQKARTESIKTGKPLFLFFTEPGSPFSQRVNREIFADEGVVALSREFVCVSVNTEKPSAISVMKEFGINAAPTVLMISAPGDVVSQITRFHSSAEFKSEMQTVLHPVARYQTSPTL